MDPPDETAWMRRLIWIHAGQKHTREPRILVSASGRHQGYGSGFVDLFRQTFASIKSTPDIGSTSPRSSRIQDCGGDETVTGRMSSPPKRHLPDIRYSSVSPTQHGRRDKQLYGSAGDVTAISRMNAKPGESTVHRGNTSNAVSYTVHPSPVTIQQAALVFANRQGSKPGSPDSSAENVNSLPGLDPSQDKENLIDTDITDEIDVSTQDRSSETKKFDTSQDTQDKTAESYRIEDKTDDTSEKENVTSGIYKEISKDVAKDIWTQENVDRRGNICYQNVIDQSEANSETSSSSDFKVRDVQNDAMNICLHQSENDMASQKYICEDQSVPRLKTIPKGSGFYSIKPTPLPRQRKFKPNVPEACSQGNQNMPVNKDNLREIKIGSVEFDEDDDHSNEKPKQTQLDSTDEFRNNRLDLGNVVDEASETSTASDNTDLNEVGAVGGWPDEKIQGILQKTSSDHGHKKTSAVQFNDEVTVETFSQTDPSSSSSTKAALAHGDGPSPIASLRLSGVTSLNESGFEPDICSSPTSPLPTFSSDLKTSPDRNHCLIELSAFSPVSKKEESNLKRRDSMQKVLSPTDLLHRKQKSLAANLINSTNFIPRIIQDNFSTEKPVCSYAQEPKKTNQNANIQSETKEISHISSRPKSPSEDEFPLPFDFDIPMPEMDEASVESATISLLDSSDAHVTKQSENHITETTASLTPKSSDNSFLLSGYNIAEYLIDSAEDDLENVDNKHRDVEESEEPLILPTLSELQQKILNENFQVTNTYSASPKHANKVSNREESDDLKTVSYSLSDSLSSKLYQNISERQTRDINAHGLDAVSCDTPPELCRISQEIDTIVKTIVKSEEPSAPDDQTIEKDSTYKEEYMTGQIEKLRLGENGMIDSLENPPDNELFKAELKEIEQIKEKAKHWRKRCKRKERLDDLCRMSQDHSQSDITLLKALANESVCSCINSAEHLDRDFETDSVTVNRSDKQQMQNSIYQVRSVDSDQDAQVKIDTIPKRLISETYHEDQLLYINSILKTFLLYIKDKQVRGIPVNCQDCKELMLIHTLMAEVSKHSKEAIHSKQDHQQGMIDDKDNVGFLQHKDSITINKMLQQQEYTRNMPNGVCNSMESIDRAEIHSPGLGAFSYTSPSKLHQKITERESAEIHSPGLGAFSYTSPSKLHQKITERESAEIHSPGLGTFSYTSPSKLHQKITERESAEIHSPGLGAFSYTSPSKLHQKITERESAEITSPGLGAFSYTSPSKLHQMIADRESAEINAPRPGAVSYIIPSESPAPDNQTVEKGSLNKEHTIVGEVENVSLSRDAILESLENPPDEELFKAELKEIEPVKEKAKHWRNRCRRKERLDDLCRRTLEHSQSDITLQKALSNESLCSSSTENLDIEVETGCVISSNRDKLHIKGNSIHQVGSVDDDKDAEVREDGITESLDSGTYQEDPFLYVNYILTNFLVYIKDKQMKDIPVTYDDYKELTLIQALMTEVSRRDKEAKNAEDEQESGITDDITSILVDKMQCQLDWAHNSMKGGYSESYLGGRSLESIRSGYLGETESIVLNKESFDDVVDQKISQCFSEDTGYGADVGNSDTFTGKSREFLNRWLSSSESLNGPRSSSESVSWICDCDRCMQRKPSERQVLSSATSLLEAELLHMLELCGWIWQRSIEANTDNKDEGEVIEQKHTEEIGLQSCDSETVSGTNESVEIDSPLTKSDRNSVENSPRLIKWQTCLEYPEDVGDVEFNIGASYVRLERDGWYSVDSETERTDGSEQNLPLMEGSPDRGHRLFGSSQNLDRRDGGGGKRKQASRSMTPDSRYMLDKEVTESQNRKLQTEVATLQTENKLLKEKYNRSQARISDLETQLAEAQEDLGNLQDNLNQEVSDLSTRTKQEISRDRDGLESKILALTKENETLKLESSSLEKKLESSHRATDMARHNSEKSRTLEAHKSEITSLKEELNRVKALLEQSERHLRDEEERHSAAGREIVKLTELKNALQQQSDSGGSAIYTDKQLKSLEKRLKVTEERLHQERADRANNLSSVEDKLLTDNAKLQASEKELSRQLHREKEKNRNFEQRVKQVREENEKLRLAMPFDDAALLSNKGKYDIPYSSHSNQRAETMKHISDDMNYILSQIEKQDGLQSRDDEEIIRTLWNKRELAYRQLQEYDVQFQELHINDNNIADGLKNLRDTYGQAESKLRSMEEQVEDSKEQVSTLDATYQQQLGVLVRERHEAFARLKTAEDLLEAVRAENEVLHRTMSVGQTGPRQPGDHSGKSIDAMQIELTNLESKVSQLTRTNQLLEAELTTIRVQLDARDKALKDVQGELDLAYNRLKGDDSEDRKQEKIDKLSAQASSLQIELRMMTDKYNSVSADNTKLESEISNLRKEAGSQKTKQHKSEQSESKAVQQLKDDVEERDSRLTSLTKQLDDLENKLQKTRQDFYIEQMHSSELESENENLQHTVGQRAQMFEALSGTEREQLAQYQILKDTLDNVSQELAQKHAQIISLDVNLSGARDNCAELEEEVRRLRKAHGGEESEQEEFTEDEQSSAHQLKIKELEKERAMLKQELEQAYSAIQASEEQYRTLQTESAQLEQELVKEKTVILQLTAEKGEIEQHLEELAEEHESLVQEKTQAEEDLIKLETKLQEILQKYENQARKQHSNFEQEYPNIPPEARQLISELESLTLIAEGKDREIGMLTDKINRQNIEIDFLHHKVELVHNDSIANREDVARMISELTLKMKEAVSTREVNQFLVGERTKLQNEKSHLEKEIDIERKNNDERRREIQDVIRKIERTETSQKSTEKDSRNKDNVIISLESELRNAKHNMAAIESEIIQLRNKVDHLNEDLKNLTGINSSLEKRLEMEQNSLSGEKNSVSKWKEEFNTLSHDFQVLQHEHTVLNDKYQAELHTVEKLKRELDLIADENTTMKEDLGNTKVELDSNRGQLLITKDTVQKLTQDKGSIYQDYEGMCRSLTEKERQLTELRERTDEKIEHLKKEHVQERVRLEQDRAAAIQERDTAKKEMDNINEQLRQKEIQLNTFGKTLQELESVTREKRQLEAHVHNLESSTGDSKVLLDGQRKELMALNEALAKQQERTTRLEAENHTLHADLKAQKESGNREARELSITINELKSQHENERHYLNDNLSQTQTRLRSVEASLAAAANDRDSLQAKARLLENTVEDLQSKLSDETTGRRLAEQSVGTLRLQLEDMKNDKNVAEARFVEMRNQLTKAEEKLKREEEKCQGVSTQLQELNALSNTNRTNVKAKSEQIDMLQREIANLKQMIETQKQNLSGKLKKTTLESKQQIEGIEEERDKLQVLNQQLSSDLDSCREHIATKNKENLKLQEEILVLEDSVRECKVKQKHAEDTLRVETDKQAEQTARFEAQEEELKRLRNFLTKKVEQSGDSDKTMWHEMNRVIQELSRQMTSHLDSTRGGDRDKSPESLVARLRKQLSESQGELKTEKSLHQITRTSLQALEEDCQRLRKQLHHYRRRDPPSGEKKHKNRMEAINAIIARSQSQAQALLASGGYFDDSMASPRVRSHQTSPKVGFHSPRHAESPDNSYSEDLSIASLPAMHYSQPSKKS